MIDEFKEKIFDEIYQKTNNIDELLDLMKKSKEFEKVNIDIATKLFEIAQNSNDEDYTKVQEYLLDSTTDKIFSKIMNNLSNKGEIHDDRKRIY